jgi:hypothetical protein
MAPQKKKQAKYEKALSKIYYTPKEVGSFGGVKPLQDALWKKGTKIKRDKIIKWLSAQDTYTLHKPIRHHFLRSKVIVGGIDHQWQADLADVSSLASKNEGIKYLLTCIDVFSKYAWVEPLKSKTGNALVTAFESILQSGRKPMILQTDQGKEFTNSKFQDYLKREGIEFFTTYNEEIKASVVERFNRTLKTKMWKYFTRNDTEEYITILDDLMWSYNHTYHRSIKMQPSKVNRKNEEEVWHHLYDDKVSYKKPKYKVGDHVRINMFRKRFKKGYFAHWSEEIFTIQKVKRTIPVRYIIRDESGDILKGSFYQEELQKVIKQDHIYRIEAELRERIKNNKKQVLVKWRGYPSSFNSWIYKRDLRKHKG